MAETEKSAFAAGFGLLWRRQNVLWWVFIVNFVCGILGILPAAVNLSQALHGRLAADKLVSPFDVGMYVELLRLPDVDISRYNIAAFVFAFVFFLFMLFVTGGIIETYREDRRLYAGDFFAASGAFFWRFVRLMLLSIIPFVIVGAIHSGLHKLADHIGDRAIADQVGIFLSLAAFVIFLLLALWVRLWFDIAQVRAVVENERRMWRNTWRSWRITWHELGGLFWIYLRIAILAWIVVAICLLLWAKVPSAAVPLTFLLLEVIIFSQLASRLWQLASATTWYQRHAAMVPADRVDYTTPHPEEVIEPEASTPPPRPDPGPELPPADA